MKKGSLSFKLITGGILVVLIPLLVVGLFSVTKTSKALEGLSRDRAMHIAGNLAEMVQVMLAEEAKFVTGLSENRAAVTAAVKVGQKGVESAADDLGVLSNDLSSVMDRIGGDYEILSVADHQGIIIADGAGGKDKGISIGDREYFGVAKSGKVCVSSPVKSRSSGKPVVPICAPIFAENGRFSGAVIAVLKIDSLCEKLGSVKIGDTGYAFMVDKSGLVIAHPDRKHILTLNMTNIAGMEAITESMLAQKAGVESYVYKGVEEIAAYAPVKMTGWSIGVTQNRDEFLGAARAIRNVIVLVGVLFLAATILAILFFARSITKPIQRIIEGLNEGGDQVSSASGQVSGASQSLAEGASEQAASIEETSSSLEEMSSMTKQNADNANQADNLMRETNAVVAKANSTMQDLTQSMQEITKASEETSKIIKTIDEIAFQTNLLALNAAVEAARAGEAGAGFAVVADEVRNLAMRAADAAKNTSNLIEGTVKKIKAGSDLVTKTHDAFGEVSRSAGKVGELVAEIAAASNEQARGIEQVNMAVAEMDKVVQRNAANAEESASASEEMNAQAEQMKGMVNGLVILIQGGTHKTTRTNSGVHAGAIASRSRAGEKTLKNASVPSKPEEEKKPLASYHTREVKPEQIIPLNKDDFKDF